MSNDAIVVAVTEWEYEKGKTVFADTAGHGFDCVPLPCEEHELATGVRENAARHAVLGVEPFVDELYQALPRGAVIARFGVGHDGVDKQKATAAGLLCTNTPGALDASVAEHAVGLMMAAARGVPELHRRMLAGDWAPQVGWELRGRRLAIIGCGPIGCQTARIASAGFGMEVVGCEIRDVDANEMSLEYGFRRIEREFADAAAGADFVSLHIPSIQATRHFLNAERLAAMPRTAWLINTARGAVLDEAALFEALSTGGIKGAALDVFENEPYGPVSSDRDLRTLPNVILVPHVGSSTVEACNRMAEQALRNIRLAELGQYDEMNLVNPEVLNQ